MAVYYPNKHWLAEQLYSLERQTWENIELWVWDDAPEKPVGKQFFSKHLERIPFHYYIGSQNLGPDSSFATLVERANGDYFAFCDQDDIWEPSKLERLISALEDRNAQVSYCTLSAINQNGDFLTKDIRTMRHGDYFLDGEGLAPKLFIKNSIYGCSMLMRAQIAKEALPLPQGMTYDHWFTLWAALCGRIVFLNESLIRHRLHESNLSTPFRGIETKQDYFNQRVKLLKTRTISTLERLENNHSNQAKQLCTYLEMVLPWVQARQDVFEKKRGSKQRLWKTREISPKVSVFEMLLPFVPDKLLPMTLALIAKKFI